MGELSRSREYLSFRSSVPQRKICVDDDPKKEWTIYDVGAKTVRCPLICLPPASGQADVFYKQMLALSAAGFRIISVNYPVYWTYKEFCEGFTKLIDYLHLDKVHLLGASVGGFLSQKYAEYTHTSPRVQSLILCNAFVDTNIFQQSATAQTFWMMPALLLKTMVMGNFQKGRVDPDIADSIDFMVESLDRLSQQELASRLTLNCMHGYVQPQRLSALPVTIMDVYDDCALSQGVKDEIYKCFPDARRAHLKTGGNFPYLSRADEVNIYLQIHLRQFEDTRFSARETDTGFTAQQLMDDSHFARRADASAQTTSSFNDETLDNVTNSREMATDNEFVSQSGDCEFDASATTKRHIRQVDSDHGVVTDDRVVIEIHTKPADRSTFEMHKPPTTPVRRNPFSDPVEPATGAMLNTANDDIFAHGNDVFPSTITEIEQT